MPNTETQARPREYGAANNSTCRRCGGTARHEQHSGGHDVICQGCGAHGVIDHETASDAWLAWVKFNARPHGGREKGQDETETR